MGRAIARLAVESGTIELVGAVSHAEDPGRGKDVGEISGVGPIGVFVDADVDAALLGADVVIDFSLPVATPALLRAARQHRVPIVMGTTGFTESEIAALDAAAVDVPLLWARNMSLGVQVLSELVEQAIRRLGSDFDAEIVELHHRHKVDSPSGTALHLMDAVSRARPEARPLTAREGQVGARSREETAIFGVRGGDVIGDHTVYLLGSGERIELSHRATNRDVFAHGALRAARWIIGKPPGRYAIADVLG